jgi:lysophospholipase L1-like esterase
MVRESIASETPLIALNGLLLLIASALAVNALAVDRNALDKHPEWYSTKSSLARHVQGTNMFVHDSRPLARNRLNLNAWFGFHEVLYKQALDLAELEVAVHVESDGYVNILYDVRDDGFSGVRISNRRDLRSVQFRASPDGRFLSVGRLALSAPVSPYVPHAVRIRFATDSAIVFLDGRALGSFAREKGPQRIGFRGGQRQAWVDNVVLRVADGGMVRESFSNRTHLLLETLAVFGLIGVMLAAGGMLAHRWLSIPARAIGFWMVIVLVGLVVSAGGAYGYELLRPRPYPWIDNRLARQEAMSMNEARQRVLPDLRRKYGDASPGGPYRLLFLGSSQTWGAGAAKLDDVWVGRLERLLNTRGGNRRIECMNAGVSGLIASQVADFVKDLLPLRPQAAVINLSSNDADTAAFRAGMDSIVATLRHANIAVVLLQEPNSPERRVTDSRHGDLAAKHHVVADVGKTYGVPVIDMQTYLAEKNGTGFLWWDFVHLTSYGQRLFAEKLAAELPALLHLP